MSTETIEDLKKKIHELELEIAKLKGANETLLALYHNRPTTIIERPRPKHPPPFPMWPPKYPSKYESHLEYQTVR